MTTFRTRINFAVLALLGGLFAGCGGGSSQRLVDTGGGGGSGSGGTQSIVVTIDQPPPPAIQLGQTVSVSAKITPASQGGVNWTCTGAADCGSFSPGATPIPFYPGFDAIEVTTSYTAPASAPVGTVIMITVTVNGNNSIVASASTVISQAASNATLTGQYALLLNSPAGSRGTGSLLGSIRFNGDGTIATGVIDIVSPTVLDLQDQILATSLNPPPNTSSYAVDSDGHGSLQIRTTGGKQLSFSFVLTSPSHALITEIDGAPGSGTMDLQQSLAEGFDASQLTGGFSFTMTGTAKSNGDTKVSSGGVFTADGASTLNNGTLDVNTAGVMSSSTFSGTFSAPDSNGRGTLQLGATRSLIYYIISPKALRILEADSSDLMGGSAYAQGNSVVFLGDNYFYEHSGWSAAGRIVTAGDFKIVEGESDISGGISDSNSGGSPTTPHLAVAVTGSYDRGLALVDAAGSSTFALYVVDYNVNILDPNASPAGFFNGGGNALMLHTDANINGTGVLIRNTQAGFPAFVGQNAIQLTNAVTTPATTYELDLIGVAPADGLGHILNGLVDYDQNDLSNPIASLKAPLAGTYVADSHQGRATGSLTVTTPFISRSAASFNVSYYRINSSQAFVMQTDTSGETNGYLVQQLFP